MRQGRKGAVAVIGSGLHHPAIICLPTAVQDPWTDTTSLYRLWFYQIYDIVETHQVCHAFTQLLKGYHGGTTIKCPANLSDIYHIDGLYKPTTAKNDIAILFFFFLLQSQLIAKNISSFVWVSLPCSCSKGPWMLNAGAKSRQTFKEYNHWS